MADLNVFADTNIYKCTYNELVMWVKELQWCWIRYRGLEDLNWKQAARIMELEFDLRKYSVIMVDDKQETLMSEYGVPENNVIPFNGTVIRPKRGGGSGGGKAKDWLSEMDWGTQFYARQRGTSQPWMLVKFMLAGIRQKTALLVPMAGTEDIVSDDRMWLAVDPTAFCKVWELYDEFPPIPLEKEDE